MTAKTRLFTLSGLQGEIVRRCGQTVPETTLRDLQRRQIIIAERDSSNRRLFGPEAADHVVRYLQRRATASAGA